MHEEDPLWIMGGNNYAVARAAQYAQNQSSESCEIANARRIVACVNACEGIQTQTLEVLPAGKIAALKTERDGAILDKMAVMMEREDRRAENERLRKLLSTAVHFAEHPEVQWVVDARAALNPAPEAAE